MSYLKLAIVILFIALIAMAAAEPPLPPLPPHFEYLGVNSDGNNTSGFNSSDNITSPPKNDSVIKDNDSIIPDETPAENQTADEQSTGDESTTPPDNGLLDQCPNTECPSSFSAAMPIMLVIIILLTGGLILLLVDRKEHILDKLSSKQQTSNNAEPKKPQIDPQISFQIQSYINKCRRENFDEFQIRKALISQGYNHELIDEFMLRQT